MPKHFAFTASAGMERSKQSKPLTSKGFADFALDGGSAFRKSWVQTWPLCDREAWHNADPEKPGKRHRLNALHEAEFSGRFLILSASGLRCSAANMARAKDFCFYGLGQHRAHQNRSSL